jgi:hypothetical protein
MVYNHIPDSTQAPERSAEEKIKIISQTIEGYRQEIEELKEKLNPTTPPEVREKRTTIHTPDSGDGKGSKGSHRTVRQNCTDLDHFGRG